MKKYIAILMTAILMTGCAADVETSTPATESTENATVITTTTVEVEENTPTDTDTEDNNSTPAITETEDTSSTTTTEAETEGNTSTPVDTTVITTVTEESNPVDTEDTAPTDNEGTVTEETPVEEKPVEEKPVEEKPVEEKPVVTTTTVATTKPVTEDKPVEEKPAVTTKPTTTTTEKKTETKPTIKSELHPEIENINLPKMNDLLNYNVKPISKPTAKELGVAPVGSENGIHYDLENLTDSYLLTDSPFTKDKNLDAYMNEKLVVGTDIPEGLYYVTYNSYTGQQSTYFKHTNKNGKEQDKIYLYAPNYREIYGFDEWNFYIYASKGDVIKGSGLALLPAPNFNFTENFYGCRYRNYYVSEKNGGIKPGTYTIKVDKEGIDETLSYVSFWRGRGMYGVYTMDKNGDFVSVTTDTYMQGGYEMDGALVDGTITITLKEGQLIEMRDLDIEFVS